MSGRIVLAHQAADLLMVYHHAGLPQGRAHAPVAITFELIADGGDRLDNGGVVGRRCRLIVVGGAGQAHQSTSF